MDYNESLKTRFMFFFVFLNEIIAKHLHSEKHNYGICKLILQLIQTPKFL